MFKLPLKQKERQILHVDADAFFASVEQVLNPKLKGKPVLVGGPTETSGVVSASSYEAKKFGVSSGMPMYLAKRKCPRAIVVPGRFDAYRDFSRRMYKIFTNYTLKVEMTSIDEAFMDITGYHEFFNKSPREIATTILTEVYKELGITVSCGLATNKTVAKVASSTNKPHKLTHVPFGKEATFLAPLPLTKLPGVGPKTYSLLERTGLKKISEFAALNIDEVLDLFGVSGIPIWKKCLGIDTHEVISNSSLPKSISKEQTFYEPVRTEEFCLKVLKQLSAQVFAKLRSYDMKTKNVFVRIRYKGEREKRRAFFRDFYFHKPLGFYSSADSELYRFVKKLFQENIEYDDPIRLIGVGVTNLVQNYNLNLFPESAKRDRLFLMVDKVKALYGKSALDYGA